MRISYLRVRRQSCSMAATAALSADNWPQWRGPPLNGVSGEKNLPVNWSTTENVTWKLRVPERSGSTPIVWGDHIFLNVGEGSESVRSGPSIATTGAVRWKRPLGGGNRRMRKQHMSSPSPVTDGRPRLGDDRHRHAARRSISPARSSGRATSRRTTGASACSGATPRRRCCTRTSLYVQVLHGMHTDDPSYLLRIDKATGKTLWRVERPTNARFESPDAYTTPALLRYGGATEIVITGGDVVTGHDPATGKELWRADGLNPNNDGNYRIVASPVVHGDMIVRAVARAAAAGAEAGRTRRRHQVARALVVQQRTRRADAGHRRHLSLFDQRPRHHVLPRREDRQDRSTARSGCAGHLQRLAGAGRRQDLHHRRRRRDDVL